MNPKMLWSNLAISDLERTTKIAEHRLGKHKNKKWL